MAMTMTQAIGEARAREQAQTAEITYNDQVIIALRIRVIPALTAWFTTKLKSLQGMENTAAPQGSNAFTHPGAADTTIGLTCYYIKMKPYIQPSQDGFLIGVQPRWRTDDNAEINPRWNGTVLNRAIYLDLHYSVCGFGASHDVFLVNYDLVTIKDIEIYNLLDQMWSHFDKTAVDLWMRREPTSEFWKTFAPPFPFEKAGFRRT